MNVPLVANTELVCQAWLAEFLPSGMISTTLPTDNSTWAASGFVVVSSAGGSTNTYTTMLTPLVYLNVFANKKASNRSPWGQANNLIEYIRIKAATFRPHTIHLPGTYPAAYMYSIPDIGEPMRRNNQAGYAQYTMWFHFNWAHMSVAV